jgi:hypothetical protein
MQEAELKMLRERAEKSHDPEEKRRIFNTLASLVLRALMVDIEEEN